MQKAPKPERQWPVIAPFEVVIHNQPHDCWVSFLGKVLDITPLITQYKDQQCVKPLLAMAGKDISHWFDERTGDIMHYVHPETGIKVPYCPHGPLPDVQVNVPATAWTRQDRPPWWKDEKYQIGLLSKKTRPIRIINMLTMAEVTITVCCEDTFYRILERYRLFNSDASSYTWRYLDNNIDMTKTLEENGIPDEREIFTELGLPQNFYMPSIFLYYNDDLKWAVENDSDDEQTAT
ncbi:cytochrome b5 domain-containing protein 1 [Anthonomus grandis grandis]|uniref:cytochrome b5 domain-containing protein 1 n=1 Tax=Anthonomus grandis grandis TaxID=2921223 RepID=UPI002166B7D2|nr:cytochrome b5 domain-containing protein 1 [Anthonomus grandis grandis]